MRIVFSALRARASCHRPYVPPLPAGSKSHSTVIHRPSVVREFTRKMNLPGGGRRLEAGWALRGAENRALRLPLTVSSRWHKSATGPERETGGVPSSYRSS